MKKIYILFFILMFPFMSFSAQIEIKFATVAPEGSTWMNVMQELNDTITEKTDGSVKFKFYPGGVSGDESDVLRKMNINQLHAAGFTSQGLGEVVKEVRILNVPLLIKNENEVDYLFLKMGTYFEKEFEKKGYIVLGWPDVGFAYVFSKKKIDSIESFKKIKMWIWGEDVLVNTLFRNIGVVPIPLSLIDVMQSLQTGMIEGVYGSPLSAIAMQWQTMVKYMLDMKIAYVPGGVLVKKNIWNKIPEKYKSVILDETRKSFTKLTQLSRNENKEALDALKKSGVVFTTINNEQDIKLFEEISNKTADDLIGKYYTREILEEVKKHLSNIRNKQTKGQ